MSTRFQSKKGDRPENIEVFCNECDEIISEEDKNTINCAENGTTKDAPL